MMRTAKYVILACAALVLSISLGACAHLVDDGSTDDTPARIDPDRPDLSVGWCAETCIQSSMAYYGVEVTQLEVNEAGEPDHADLYAYDIDDALDDLSVEYVAWDESIEDVDAFITWIQDALRAGHPLLCGIKIYPDEHPDWSLDHFVLAVGFTPEGLILNTQLDLDGQVLVAYTQLKSADPGYSFASSWNECFGRAITGVAGAD